MTNYSFDVEHAQKYGVDEAILIANFKFWIMKNKANNKHYYEGRTWTYNSADAFGSLFPFWSDKQIRRILSSLLERNIIQKGNFNKDKRDRTCWYSFVNEAFFLGITKQENADAQKDKCILPNGQMQITKRENATSQKGKCIYVTDNKLTDSKKTSKKNLPDWIPKTEWNAWLEMRKLIKPRLTDYATQLAIEELQKLKNLGHDPQEVINEAVLKGWKSFYPPRAKGNIDEKKPDIPASAFDFEQHCLQLDKDWQDVAVNIHKLVGNNAYRSWFSSIKFVEIQGDNTLIMTVPSRFIREYLTTQYSRELKQAIAAVYGHCTKYEVFLDNTRLSGHKRIAV